MHALFGYATMKKRSVRKAGGLCMFHIELIIEFLENVMNNIVQVAILFFEFVGVIVIILSGLKGFIIMCGGCRI